MQWFMLTVVGKDKPAIVAHIASALFEGDCELGEASMLRLGGNFTIMLMVKHDGNEKSLQDLIGTETQSLGLQAHIDKIDGALHHHVEPDVRITVHGADRAGIVAKVTGALVEAGLNILSLESDVGGTEEQPIYIMSIEGRANEGIASLESALSTLTDQGVEANLRPVEAVFA